MDTSEPIKRTRVRAYVQDFKARVVAECEQPGASVSKVALALTSPAKRWPNMRTVAPA
jgi:transposase-like protein